MTKPYHLTQEQALKLLVGLPIDYSKSDDGTLITILGADSLQAFANAALDKVLGEPDYYGLTKDHTWLSIAHEQYMKLKPNMRMVCYAPKEMT